MKSTMKKIAAGLVALLIMIQMVPALGAVYSSGMIVGSAQGYKDKLDIIASKGTYVLLGQTLVIDVNEDYIPTWKSSNEDILTIDEKGVVTALAEGVATVTATVGYQEAKIDVTVIDPAPLMAEVPAEETPAEDTNIVEETPSEETPVEETKEETPAQETPAEETKEETPAQETPAEETKEETPAEETPAEETKEETPAQETPAEETKEETPAEETKEETPAKETPAEETKEETPAQETPVEETKEEGTPAKEPPAEETKEEETPAKETPAEETKEETPAKETPAEETKEETPAEETKEETPAQETPAEETKEETSVQETPAEETPAEETPAEETPAEETPAEETPAEDPTPAPAAKRPLVIVINGENERVTYNGEEQVLDRFVATSNEDFFDASKIKVSGELGVKATECGIYELKLEGIVFTYDDPNAVAHFVVNNSFLKITPAPVTVTANAVTKNEGEADPELTATVVGLFGDDTVEYTLTRQPGETVGEYIIEASGEEKQGNYRVNYVAGMMEIIGKPVVRIETSLVPGQAVYAGTEVTMKAIPAGFGDAELSYQWEYSKDGGKTWEPIEDATKKTYTYIITAENARYSYRVYVEPVD